MEQKLNRIQKISNIAYIVCKVLFILSIVGACITVAGLISFEVLGDFTLRFGGVDIHNMIEGFDEMTQSQIIMTVINSIAECVVGAVLFGFGSKYLKNELSDGTPFTINGSKEVLKLGIITIAVPLAVSMVVSIIGEILKSAVDFKSEIPVSAGVILILLSFIFSYGADLKENKSSLTEKSENK